MLDIGTTGDWHRKDRSMTHSLDEPGGLMDSEGSLIQATRRVCHVTVRHEEIQTLPSTDWPGPRSDHT